MTFINFHDDDKEDSSQKHKQVKIEFGVEFNEYEEKEINIIKVYTLYDPPLIHDYKKLSWRRAQYRPERQDGKVLYWVFAERVLDDVLAILEKHNYYVKDKKLDKRMKLAALEAKKTFMDYEVDDDNLKLINEAARPGTSRWAERVLREHYNFQKLMEQNPNLEIKFNFDNSREVSVTMKDLNAAFQVAIPLKYPDDIPVTKLEGDWKDTNFADQAQITYYKKIMVACLGDLKKRWTSKMTIAHFIKLFVHYLAAAQYSETISKEVVED
ncbi:MAG: hypothetical protein HWN66_21770 [Candidatus Helarchaeota archaeon]|nr:hypothetical protein [Candidatus Helarchaeota archaeon]